MAGGRGLFSIAESFSDQRFAQRFVIVSDLAGLSRLLLASFICLRLDDGAVLSTLGGLGVFRLALLGCELGHDVTERVQSALVAGISFLHGRVFPAAVTERRSVLLPGLELDLRHPLRLSRISPQAGSQAAIVLAAVLVVGVAACLQLQRGWDTFIELMPANFPISAHRFHVGAADSAFLDLGDVYESSQGSAQILQERFVAGAVGVVIRCGVFFPFRFSLAVPRHQVISTHRHASNVTTLVALVRVEPDDVGLGDVFAVFADAAHCFTRLIRELADLHRLRRGRVTVDTALGHGHVAAAEVILHISDEGLTHLGIRVVATFLHQTRTALLLLGHGHTRVAQGRCPHLRVAASLLHPRRDEVDHLFIVGTVLLREITALILLEHLRLHVVPVECQAVFRGNLPVVHDLQGGTLVDGIVRAQGLFHLGHAGLEATMLDGVALLVVALILEQVRTFLGHAHHGLLHADVALALLTAVLVYRLFAGLVRRLERRGAGLGVVVQTVDFGARPHLCGLLLHAALPGADLTTHCTVGVVLAVVGHVVGLTRVVELALAHHLQAVVHIGLAQWVTPGVGSELTVVGHHELIDGIGAQGLFDLTALAGGHTAAGDCTHCLEQHLGTTVAQQLLLELLRQQGNHLIGHALSRSAFGLWAHRALHALQQGIEERFGGRISLLTQALDYRRSGLAQGQAHVLSHRIQHVQGGTGTHGVTGAFMTRPTLGHVTDLVGQRAGIVGQPIDVAAAVRVRDTALGLDP